jgi:SOS-response transcriptional repressor LexA
MSAGTTIRQLRKAKKLTILELANLIGSDVGNLSRLERDKQGYSPEMLDKIALALDVSVSDLFSDDSNVTDLATRGKVPLISWVQAGEWCDAHDSRLPGDADEWLPCPVRHTDSTFALRVVGESMDGPGGYREGEVIFVDPGLEAMTGKDVIARTPNGKVTFKRLKEDDQGRYLVALNPTWPDRIIRVPEGTVICGVVIGSFMPR